MRAAIIDYDAGNLHSVRRACAEVGLDAEVTADAAVAARAERLIFPGVGSAGSAMPVVRERGFDRVLREAFDAGVPILGICLGLQVSLEHSEEKDTPTLGLLPGRVRRFRLADPQLKVPHMGWNAVRVVRPHPVLDGIGDGDEFYFVHGYYPEPSEPSDVLAVARHGIEFCCAAGRGSYVGTQFHPEKSGRLGLELIARFARWDGCVAQPEARASC
jgi:glutamine amidotransferase